uniref:SCAN domain-containing protein 3 n=1 Tax=Cacopsylla melanoneura TaxID=428564 RepID=A0A8D9EPM7_9HEMI
MVNILSAQDKVAGFIRKLELYKRRTDVEDISMFSELTMILDQSNEECTFTKEIGDHLSSVISCISKYFPNLENRETNAWVLRPFSVNEESFPDSETQAKVQFLGLREDNTLKHDFEENEISTFWIRTGNEYPLLSEKALRILVPFATTYRCESGFSTMVTLKTKSRNRLMIEHDMRCALCQTKPDIKKIVKNKQYQPSH